MPSSRTSTPGAGSAIFPKAPSPMALTNSKPTHSPSPSLIASNAAAEAEAGYPGRQTLLIVDDEEGPRQSLRIVFKSEYNVLVASSGPEAINLARSQPVNIAVLDIMMAGMSGTELLGHLKEINPSMEVVMLTAYETLETARQSL